MPTPGDYLKTEIKEPAMTYRYNVLAVLPGEALMPSQYDRTPKAAQRIMPAVKRRAATPGRRVIQAVNAYDFFRGG